MTIYPTRPPYYAHRLTRLLFKSCAAQSIGQDAVLLIIHICHTEDAARYQGPVRFWNSQLSETLGFRSPKTLNNARKKAVESGWLHYERKNDRADGRYWTTIPESVSKFDDNPIETDVTPVPSTEQKTERKAEQKGYAKRRRKVTGNDLPPIPVPSPLPIPDPSTTTTTIDRNFLENLFSNVKRAVVIIRAKGVDVDSVGWGRICQALSVGMRYGADVFSWIDSAQSKVKLTTGYFASCANTYCKSIDIDFDAEKLPPEVPYEPATLKARHKNLVSTKEWENAGRPNLDKCKQMFPDRELCESLEAIFLEEQHS
jgi:hypothetical protein